MTDVLLVLVSTALVNNFVLVQFLGLCPFLGVSSKLESALGMSLATTFVLTLSSAASHLLHRYLLVPLDLTYLRIILFIVVIAGLVQLIQYYLKSTSPVLHSLLGLYLPLITSNCAVLGVTLLAINQNLNLLQTLVFSIGAAGGFTLVTTPCSTHRTSRFSASTRFSDLNPSQMSACSPRRCCWR